jgi:hypothetical protein
MDVLLESVPLYTNQEEIRNLQSQPNAEELVADQISGVIAELASDLLTSVAAELSTPNVAGCIKNFEKAEELRISGNALFSKGKYLQAVELFSKSFAFLNSSNSRSALEAETCAKVLCNRALCLSKLKYHKLAEIDSTEAIFIKPDHAKAYYRRSIALQGQNDFIGAKRDAERAVKILGEQGASTEEAEALLTLLEKCKIDDGGGGDGGRSSDVGKKEKAEPVWTTHSVPQDLWNEEENEESNPQNTTDSSASATSAPINWSCSLPEISNLAETRSLLDPKNSIKIAESSTLGRHLVVGTHDLQESTDIIQDQPVAHVLVKSQRLNRCGHCCQELPLQGAYFWSCKACCITMFCSRECRDHEDVHHVAGGPECGVPWPVLLPPEVVLAVRLACRLKRDQETTTQNNDDNDDAIATATTSSKVVSSLHTCFSEIDTEDAIWRATTACAAHAAYTIAYQRSSTKTTSGAPPQPPISIADVLRALGIVHLNGLAIIPTAFGTREESTGIAVYPVASFLSHSCIPNVSVRFEGNTVIIRTLSSLPPGTPLYHCYGPQVGEMTTAQRRMMLKDQYHFFCECDACVVRSSNGPTGTKINEEVEKEVEMVGLRCSATKGCTGAMRVPACSTSTGGKGTVIDAGIVSKYDLVIEDEEKTFSSGTTETVGGGSSGGGCTKCGGHLSEVDWNTIIAPNLQKASKYYSTGCEMLELMMEGAEGTKNQVEMAVAVLEGSLRIREILLHRYNQVLGTTHSSLSWVDKDFDISLGANTGDTNEKNSSKQEESKQLVHCRACLEIAERAFPAESTNVAFERLRLGMMLQESGSKDGVEQGKLVFGAAMRTLERHFGSAAADAVKEEKYTGI